jgi:hypothetical protein
LGLSFRRAETVEVEVGVEAAAAAAANSFDVSAPALSLFMSMAAWIGLISALAPGLPDLSWYNLPKRENIQNNHM